MLAKSVDSLRKEVADLKGEIKKESTISPLQLQTLPQLTISAIWPSIPTEEQKLALHETIQQTMKTHGIREALIKYTTLI